MVQVSGQLDQSAGMLDESVKDKGYALLCVSEPTTDCKIRVIDEVHSTLTSEMQAHFCLSLQGPLAITLHS